MRQRWKWLLGVLVLFVAGNLYAGGNSSEMQMADSGLMVDNAWVRLVPPVSRNSAVYMTLHNSGRENAVVVGAQSPVAEVVQVHQTKKQNNMIMMGEVKELVVPAEGAVTFEPGSYHIMLINIVQPLKEGEVVPITLTLKSGDMLELKAPVKAAGVESEGVMHKHQ